MNNSFFKISAALFSALLAATSFYFLFQNEDFFLTGILFFLWAILALMIILLAYERAYYFNSQKKTQDQPQLSEHLISSMDRMKSYNAGFKSLKSLNIVTMLVVVVGIFYSLSGVYSSLYPAHSETLHSITMAIEGFFSRHSHGGPLRSPGVNDIGHSLALKLGYISLIAICFWFAQFFSFAMEGARYILWLASFIFFGSVYFLSIQKMPVVELDAIPVSLWLGYGWVQTKILIDIGDIPSGLSSRDMRLFETGIVGVIWAYIPSVIVSVALARNFRERLKIKIMAAYGLILLALMFYADTHFPSSHTMMALWLSGWTCLGCLIVRDRIKIRKTYRLYH
jgi:hypothetical protein